VLLDGLILDFVGRMSGRLIVLEDGQWRAVEACPGVVATVFSTPDVLWTAWAEQDEIHWAPIAEP
jgi:hypothetical protein